MKKINFLDDKKWWTTAILIIAIAGLVWLVIWWQMKKKEVTNEISEEIPKLQTEINSETLKNLQATASEQIVNKSGETTLNNMSEVYGLTPTQAYLKMKSVETQIKTAGDFLNMITNYYDSLTIGEIWDDWKKLATDEEKVSYIQEKLAQTPRLSQLVEVTETIDAEMGRAFLTATTSDGRKVAVVMNLDLTNEGEKLWYVISEGFIK